MLVCPLCRNVLAKGEAVCPRDGQTPLTRELQPIPAALAARFAIVEPFGEGDAGSLYLVDDKQTGRRGLLKLLRGASAWTVSERSRLKRELVKQATLTHPALVVPLATGEAENCVWLFREWIDGVSLSVKLARSGAIAVPEALAIAAQIASALDELHRAGLLMRDLSPGHVLVTAQPSGVPKVSLIDAGVAMRVGGSSGIEITGKPAYISPEHASGKLVSFRSDLYSLGCVIHEMLTGHPVFRGTTEQLLEAQRTQAPGSINAPLPSGVASLIAQLLVKEPRDRPFSAQQVRRALEPFLPEDAGGRRREPTAAFAAGEHARALPDSKGTGTLRPVPRKQTLVGFAVPKPGSDRTEELSALDLAGAEQALGRRSDATQELSSLDLARAERVLGAPDAAPPPRFRRDGDPTMPLSPSDLAASRPGRRSAPPPPPGARPKTAPPPPPAAAKSVRPPPPGAAAITTSPGIAPTPEPTATAASTAGDLDYEDLAETTALEREEAHALVDAPPPSAASAQAALAPTLQAFPASPEPASPPADPPASVMPASSSTPAPRHVADPEELAVSEPRRSSRMPLYVVGGLIGFCVLATGTGLLGSFLWAQLLAPAPIATSAPVPEPVVRTQPVGSRPTVVAERTHEPVAPVVEPAAEPVPEPVPEPVAEPAAEDAVAAVEPAEEPAPAEPAAAAEPAAEPESTATDRTRRSSSTGARASSDSSGGRPQIASTLGPRGASAPAAGPRTFDQLRSDARAAFQARRYDDAARAYEQASRMRPRDAAVWAGLGAARLQGGNARSAIEAYRRAVSLEPRNVRYHLSIGRAFAAAGDRNRARQAFEHALSLDPRNREARTQLGRL